MKYKHIIWDYNGTILDDAQLVLDTLNHMLQKRDLPTCSMEKYREIFDFPVIKCYSEVGFDFDKYPFAELADEFTHIYEENFASCGLRNGAAEVIARLDAQGYQQSILTAGREKHIKKEIGFFGLGEYIKEVTGLHNNKAESKVFLAEKHLNKIKVDPKYILFIGDTTHDNEVADAIGCDCVLLAGGHQSEERLNSCNNKVALTPEDIYNFL
ncbi:MAG: HAD family hydrolase [Clostridia bacterium]|nr:HAD family hydrolase [Clostridia bacterium]